MTAADYLQLWADSTSGPEAILLALLVDSLVVGCGLRLIAVALFGRRNISDGG